MVDERKKFEACQVGDVVARDIIDYRNGVVLCARGHVLTQEILCWLEKFRFSDIYVQKQDWGKVWNINENHSTVYKNSMLNLKSILEETRIKGTIQKRDIDAIAHDFFQVLSDNSTIMGCVNMIKDIGSYTYAHSLNVGMLAVLIGKWLHLPTWRLEELFYAGVLHDIGKYSIPPTILHKRGNLDEKEIEILRAHVQLGGQILQNIPDINQDIKLGVWTHHERQDGSGYPRKLKGNQIHLYGKILGIADVYDAMISDRVYKKKETPFNVMEHLMTEELGKLDADILMTFLKNIADYYVGVKVRLSTYEEAEVVFIPSQCIYRPIVKVGENYIDLCQKKDIKITEIV